MYYAGYKLALEIEHDAHEATKRKLQLTEQELTKARQLVRQADATTQLLGDAQRQLATEKVSHDCTKSALLLERAEHDTTRRAFRAINERLMAALRLGTGSA